MSNGIQKKLRYFFLSLEEKIYKCESPTCLYPFERFMFKSLTDGTVYYYEEVMPDGKRELFFRVPLDEQSNGPPSNPLQTDLFCDNQQNPNIEEYGDFSDLFNDLDDIDFDTGQPKVPTTASNPDHLEFLDEIDLTTNSINASHSTNDIDSIIDEILNESPAQHNAIDSMPSTSTQSPSLPSMPQNQSPAQSAKPSTEKPKLSKCIQHMEKVKKAQSRKKTSEKSKQSFTEAILEARKNQTMTQNDSASAIQQQTENQQMARKRLQLVQFQRSNSPASMLTSTSNLRPIELARRLSTLKSLNIKSRFLQQYMKTKEDNLFGAEAEFVSQVEKKVEQAVTSSNVSMNDGLPPLDANLMNAPMDPPNSTTILKKSSSTNKSTPRKSTKKDCDEEKKGGTSRSKKANSVESAATTPSTATVPTKRKYVRKNQTAVPCSTSTENVDLSKEASIDTEPKKNARKRKATPTDNDDKAVGKGNNENIGPIKRQRNSKCAQISKTEQNDDDKTKPKRGRTPKLKINPMAVQHQKQQQPSSSKVIDLTDTIDLSGK